MHLINLRYRRKSGLRNTVSRKGSDTVKEKQLAKHGGEKLALEALKHRWRKQCENACDIDEAEERLRILQKEKLVETARRECEIENTATCYTMLCEEERNNTSPLLLNSAVIPIAEPSCSGYCPCKL